MAEFRGHHLGHKEQLCIGLAVVTQLHLQLYITYQLHVPAISDLRRSRLQTRSCLPVLTLTPMIVSYCIMLCSFSDSCIQPDDGQIRNGRNM